MIFWRTMDDIQSNNTLPIPDDVEDLIAFETAMTAVAGELLSSVLRLIRRPAFANNVFRILSLSEENRMAFINDVACLLFATDFENAENIKIGILWFRTVWPQYEPQHDLLVEMAVRLLVSVTPDWLPPDGYQGLRFGKGTIDFSDSDQLVPDFSMNEFHFSNN